MKSAVFALAIVSIALSLVAQPSERAFELSSKASVVEIISQTKQRHLPVVVVGDENQRKRALPYSQYGHPVYLLKSSSEKDILELIGLLVKKYDLKPKVKRALLLLKHILSRPTNVLLRLLGQVMFQKVLLLKILLPSLHVFGRRVLLRAG